MEVINHLVCYKGVSRKKKGRVNTLVVWWQGCTVG